MSNTNLKLLSNNIPSKWNLLQRQLPDGTRHTNVSLTCNPDCKQYSGQENTDFIKLTIGPANTVHCCNQTSPLRKPDTNDKTVIVWDNTVIPVNSTLRPNYLLLCSNAGRMWGNKNPSSLPKSTQVNISDGKSDQYYYCPTGR